VAEGDKQATILKAEGGRQAEILQAEGDQEAAVLRAQGFSEALDRIFSVAKGIDGKTMTLQYFEALKQVGSSPSTKFVFPMELASFLRPVRQYASEIADGDTDGGEPGDRD
jgi:regulator of protease activity HflC (stomatin/prohibitin superfamily)